MKFLFPIFLIFCSCSKNKIDLSDLLAPPSTKEKQEVLELWNSRDVSVRDWKIITSKKWNEYQVDVVSHTVNGKTHFGLIRYPYEYTESKHYGALMVNHGGIDGCSLSILNRFFNDSYKNQFIVVPSYIGEPLDTQDMGLGVLVSEGEKSFFDKDIDDVIALLNSVLSHYKNIDEQSLSIYGDSRGACVAYLVSIRDQRFTKGVYLYGSTDHLSYPNLNELLYSKHRNDVLPWVARITAINAYEEGYISLKDARIKLLQKSPLHFAHLLPKKIQIHHGAKDKVVYVENSRRLSEILGKDTTMQSFTYFEYKKGGHGTKMPELYERAAKFLTNP